MIRLYTSRFVVSKGGPGEKTREILGVLLRAHTHTCSFTGLPYNEPRPPRGVKLPILRDFLPSASICMYKQPCPNSLFAPPIPPSSCFPPIDECGDDMCVRPHGHADSLSDSVHYSADKVDILREYRTGLRSHEAGTMKTGPVRR